MFSFPCSPLGSPFVYFLYTLGSPRVLFGGLIYSVFIHKKKCYRGGLCQIFGIAGVDILSPRMFFSLLDFRLFS